MRRFVGLSLDDAVWDATTFTKNRQRFGDNGVTGGVLDAAVDQAHQRRLLSEQHFCADGTLIDARALMGSYRSKGHDRTGKMIAARFSRNLVAAAPHAVHTTFTENGIQCTNRAPDHYASTHIFDRICQDNAIDHRLTQVKYPWINGHVVRMNGNSRKQPSSASTTKLIISSASIWPISSTPIALLDV